MLSIHPLFAPLVPGISAGLLAAILGVATGILTGLGTHRAMRDLGFGPGYWPVAFAVFGMFLGATFSWTALELQWQSTPDVTPPEAWRQWRVLYHLTLLILLLIITATDLRSYFILNWTCYVGIVIAVAGAAVSGQFQIAHIWVDWSTEIPQLRGPYRPEWLSLHPHLHGVAWSLAGLACGVVSTWLIRWIGSWILGMNALGSGDVLLMAMVGAYIGWQPTLVVTLLAPILAFAIGGFERLRGNRAALPYGPFLALASLIVLFFWRWIWMAEFSLSSQAVANPTRTFAVRRFFGDPVAMGLIAGLSIGLFVVLLSLLRIYKSLPTQRRS